VYVAGVLAAGVADCVAVAGVIDSHILCTLACFAAEFLHTYILAEVKQQN
jgi:hypothetical protein